MMKSTDRFLIGIVVGIVLLVVAAFVVTLTRPEPTYQAEDTPEGVAHNYLLALQKEDYQRAYGYLSPTLQGYPVSAERFAEDVEDASWVFRLDTDTTLAVESAKVTANRAVVKVRESRFNGRRLFDSSQSITIFEIELQLEDGEWKIVDADHYFAWCWKHSEGCKQPTQPPSDLPRPVGAWQSKEEGHHDVYCPSLVHLSGQCHQPAGGGLGDHRLAAKSVDLAAQSAAYLNCL